jgi:hypothetical protein
MSTPSYPEKVDTHYKQHQPPTEPGTLVCWTASELLKAGATEPTPVNGDRWGDWCYNTSEPPSIDYCGGGYKSCPYQVLLDDVNTDRKLIHWVGHLMGKDWGRKSIGDFLAALYDLDVFSGE